jgi:hypothetical protein
MLYFATLFDRNYYSRGLALFSSMRRHIPRFRLFVLCLDDIVFDQIILLGDQRLIPIKLAEVERSNPELLLAKANRSWVEYIFTLSPCWPYHLLQHRLEIDRVITLDADIYFFSDPTSLIAQYQDKSILITPHNFSPKQISLGKEKYGKYNVSFQAFKRDKSGLACLEEWQRDCLDWCHDYLDNDRFADQKYLDGWPTKYGNDLAIIDHPGTGLAPWNVENFSFSRKWGTVYANREQLIYFHFQHVRFIRRRIATLGLNDYEVQDISPILLNYVYAPYLHKLITHQTGGDQTARYLKFYPHETVIEMLRLDKAHLLVCKNWLTASNRSFSFLKYFPNWASD